MFRILYLLIQIPIKLFPKKKDIEKKKVKTNKLVNVNENGIIPLKLLTKIIKNRLKRKKNIKKCFIKRFSFNIVFTNKINLCHTKNIIVSDKKTLSNNF